MIKGLMSFFLMCAGFEAGYWVGWLQLAKDVNHAPATLAAVFGSMALGIIIINIFWEL